MCFSRLFVSHLFRQGGMNFFLATWKYIQQHHSKIQINETPLGCLKSKAFLIFPTKGLESSRQVNIFFLIKKIKLQNVWVDLQHQNDDTFYLCLLLFYKLKRFVVWFKILPNTAFYVDLFVYIGFYSNSNNKN